MFKKGLKDLTITELAHETGIDRSKIYTYINTGTPDDYTYTKGKASGGGNAPYLLSKRDIEMLSMIHELAQKYSIREVKEILGSPDFEKNNKNECSEKIIVPQVYADFIDEYNKEKKLITDVFLYPKTEKEKDLVSYMFYEDVSKKEQIKRQELLFEALANGYDEVEEMKYKVIFEDNDAGFFLYKADDVSVTISNDLNNYDEYRDRLMLTENEINNYDSRFMMFVH